MAPQKASAGNASLIDYPEAKGLQAIAAKMYADGAIISAVYGYLDLERKAWFGSD